MSIDHHTNPASELVATFELGHVPYGHKKHTFVANAFICMRLNNHKLSDRKGAWKGLSEGHKHLIIRTVQKFWSSSDSTQKDVILVGKAADLISRATFKCTRRFLRDDIEEK